VNAPPIAPAIGGIDTTYANAPIGYSVTSAAMNSDGSATVRVNARVTTAGASVLGVLGTLTCNVLGVPLCYSSTVTVPMALIGDHDILDPSNANMNWFFRNKWHEVGYYAVAPNIVPSGTRSCSDTPPVTCLQVAYHRDKNNIADDTKMRGILVISGRTLTGATRPNGTLTDWMEGPNCRPIGAPECALATSASQFAVRASTLLVNRTFNDHIAVVDRN
jgi:hypothetical protein